MSNTVDNRVVSMQFDNAEFERNVNSTMSSLDRLKGKLNFRSNCFDPITRAANNVDLGNISRETERVNVHFSALQVAAITVISNITTKVMELSANILKAFTIEPIFTGFQEYETQIQSVQTILANTSSAGTTIADVNRALDTLNTYADKTIYNFTQMTRNIGTFTAAGVGLWDSVEAIQGIANLAAVSGSTSQQASTAMYQLSQALSQGYVMLMDWRSVVNAGMGGEYFKSALQDTAEQMLRFDESYQEYWRNQDKTAQYSNLEALMEGEGGFRNSLQTLWMSSDVLMNTLRNLTESGANEYIAEHTRLVDADRQYLADEIEALRSTAKESNNLEEAYHTLAAQLAETSDLTEEEIYNLLNNSTTAEEAATKVKTLTQLFDTLKEAAQSGWTQTWEILVGDFEEAKELFTEISDAVSGLINSTADARNNLLADVMYSNWKKLTTAFSSAGISSDDLQDNLAELASTVGVDISQFATFEDSLSENWVSGEVLNNALAETVRQMAAAKDVSLDFSGNVADLTREQLISIGMTSEQAEEFSTLASGINDADSEVSGLLGDLGRMGGRDLLIDSLRNALKGLWAILKEIGGAFRDMFPAVQAETIYNFLERLHEFSQRLIPTQETLEKIHRTFRGLFAVLHIIWTVLKTIFTEVFRLAARGLGAIFGATSDNILDFTANVGDSLVAFHDWLMEGDRLAGVIRRVFGGITEVLRTVWHAIKAVFSGGESSDEDGILGFFSRFFNRIREIFGGTDSEAEETIDGANRFTATLERIGNAIKTFLTFIKDHFIPIMASAGLIFGIVMAVKFASFIAGIINIVGQFARAVKNFAELIGSISGVFEETGKLIRSQRLKNMAMAVLIIAGSVALIIAAIIALSVVEPSRIAAGLITVGAIMLGMFLFLKYTEKINLKGVLKAATVLIAMGAALALITGSLIFLAQMDFVTMVKNAALLMGVLLAMVGISKLMTVIEKGQKGNAPLIRMALSLLIMAFAMKTLGDIDLKKAYATLPLLLGMIGLMAAISLASNGVDNLKGMAGMLLFAVAIRVLVSSLKSLSEGDLPRIHAAMKYLVEIFALFGAIIIASKFAGENAAKAGGMLLLMSFSLLIMTGVIGILSGMEPADIAKGLITITALSALFVALMALAKVSTLSAGDVIKIASSLIIFSSSIAVMAVALRILATAEPEKLAAATTAMIVVMGAIAAMSLVVSKIKGIKFSTFMAIFALMGVVTGIAGALSGLMVVAKSTEDYVAAVASISILLAAFIAITVILSKERAEKVQVSLDFLGVFVGLVTVLGVVIALLSRVSNGDAALKSAAAISLLLAAMIVCLKLAGSIPKPNLIETVASLTLMVGIVAILAGIVAILCGIPGSWKALEIAESLSLLLATMTGVLVVLTFIGMGGPLALIGIASLMALIGAFGGVALLIGKLFNSDTEAQLTHGLEIMGEIGHGIGNFVGSIIGGIAEGISSSLPAIAENISLFATALEPFIKTMSSVDERVVEGMTAVSRAILVLVGAELLNAIAGFLGSNMADFSVQFVAMGAAITAFALTVSVVRDWTAVSNAANNVKKLCEALSSAPRTGGLLGALFGRVDMAGLTTGIPDLGVAVTKYARIVSTVGNWDVVNSSSKALLNICRALKACPREGGLVDRILGARGFESMASNMADIGTALINYHNAVSAISDWSATVSSTDALKHVFQALKDAPNSGGLLADVLGDQNYTLLADNLTEIGTALSNYATSISDSPQNWDEVERSAGALTVLFSALEDAPNSGGILGDIFGDQNYSNLADNLTELGEGLSSFAEEISGVNVGSLNTSSRVIESLVNSAVLLANVNNATTSLESFGTRLTNFGQSLVEFYNDTSEISIARLEQISQAVSDFVGDISQIGAEDASGVSEFSGNVTNAVNTTVSTLEHGAQSAGSRAQEFMDGVGRRFTGPSARNVLQSANTFGLDVDEQIGDGLADGSGTAISGVSNVMDSMSNVLSDGRFSSRLYEGGFTAGADGGRGIADGLRSKISQVEQTGREIGAAGVRGARSKGGLDAHSPSRALYRVGRFGVIGFINAFKDGIGESEETGRDMASSAVDGFRSSLNRIKLMSDIIDSGFDLTPVITPVVDLSNVRKGADAINAMMSTSKAYSVAGGFGGYGIQNGNLNRNTTNVFNITNNVDGSDNPELWALSFAKGLQRKIRMGG